ncbi:hypothetical protein ASA1KI_24690 [Opitutales bacterium ASA1]|nr:hypothetical protein ASA1KI_24690 [Opitutales bacterium ASA1]
MKLENAPSGACCVWKLSCSAGEVTLIMMTRFQNPLHETRKRDHATHETIVRPRRLRDIGPGDAWRGGVESEKMNPSDGPNRA